MAGELTTYALSQGIGLVLGGGEEWRATLAAMKTRLAADDGTNNPHALPAMASPPTVNAVAQNPVPTGFGTLLAWEGANTLAPYLFPASGKPKTTNTFYVNFPVATIGASGGNVGNGENALAWRLPFKMTADKVAFRFAGSSIPSVRFIIDGKYLSKTAHSFASTGGANYLYFDLPRGLDTYVVWVEGELSQGFSGLSVPAGQSVALASGLTLSPDILLLLGDSFTEGAGATRLNDGFGTIAGERLLFDRIFCSGSGGTGYLNNGGTKLKLADRLVADIQRAKDMGNVPLVIIPMGLNDLGFMASQSSDVQAQVVACLNITRSMLPGAVIMPFTGVWDNFAPGAVSANYTAFANMVASVCSGRGGVFPISMQGVVQTHSGGDSVHPDDAGHNTDGIALAAAVRAVIAAA